MIRIEKYEAAGPMTVYKVGSIRKSNHKNVLTFTKEKNLFPHLIDMHLR